MRRVLSIALLFMLCTGCTPSQVALPEIPASAIQQFAALEEDKYSEWLHDLEARFEPGVQLYLIGAAPEAPPTVLAQPADDNGNAPAVNWPAPWPGIQQAMASPVAQETTVSDTYQGRGYTHRLTPLNPSGRICLVTTTASAPRNWLSYKTLIGVSVMVLIVGLVLQKMRGG